MCTVAGIYIAVFCALQRFCDFFKVNLFFEKVGIIAPLEIKFLWLPANRGKYEEMSCSSFLC